MPENSSASSAPVRLAATKPFPWYERTQELALALVLILICGLLKIGGSAYIAFAFGGSFIIFLGTRPARGSLIKSLVLAAVFAAVYHLHHGVRVDYFGSGFGTLMGFLGMGAVQTLAGEWIFAKPAAKRKATPWASRTVQNLRYACAIPALCVGSMLAVGTAAQLTPVTYDPLVYAFDGKFGFPSWVIGQAFRSHMWLWATCGVVYNTLPLALSVCLAMQWQYRVKFPIDMGAAVLSIGVVGFLLYQICPAAGPVYLFPNDFPTRVPHVLDVMRIHLPPAPRNGMPSLHVAWALLMAWNLRVRRILLPVGFFFLGCTILATIGSGEHYLADLIVSPALVLAIQSAFRGIPNALRPAGLTVGSAITLGWLIAFRTGAAMAIPSGQFAWWALAASVLTPAMIAWRANTLEEKSEQPDLVQRAGNYQAELAEGADETVSRTT